MHDEYVQAALRHSIWMSWNALLALVPLALSHRLFRGDPHRPRTTAWWAGLVAFILFLPNAPYVLTDVVHLIDDVRYVQSDTVITLVVIPVYAVFFIIGMEAYVLAVTELSQWLRRQGVARPGRLTIRLGLHLLCAIGIGLGRIERLNSWDTAFHPMRIIDGLVSVLGHPVWLAATFAIVTIVFNFMKVLTLALQTWWRTSLASPA
jgi:uncharacterized membrane protein